MLVVIHVYPCTTLGGYSFVTFVGAGMSVEDAAYIKRRYISKTGCDPEELLEEYLDLESVQ